MNNDEQEMRFGPQVSHGQAVNAAPAMGNQLMPDAAFPRPRGVLEAESAYNRLSEKERHFTHFVERMNQEPKMPHLRPSEVELLRRAFDFGWNAAIGTAHERLYGIERTI